MEKILEIKNITKRFPGVLALNDVSFDIHRGEVHILIGENGAGKSTLMKILSGVYQPDEGKIILNSEAVSFKNPKEAQEAGVSIIHQEFSLIPYLNAVENIFLGREMKKKNGLLDKKKMKVKAQDLLDMLGVEINLERPVQRLSVAEQQFIEIAKAVAVNDRILILDEPTATLTKREVKILFQLIQNLKNKGVTMIYISHHLEEAFEIGDRLTCLRDGTWINTRPVKELTQDEIIRMMVGRSIDNIYPKRTTKLGDEELLQVRNLKQVDSDFKIDFSVKKGEVLGIAGLVGSGRTELVRALIGADQTDSKEIYISGEKVETKSPEQALKAGIGLIPENRKSQGLVLDMSVKNNISLASLSKVLNSFLFLDKLKEKNSVTRLIDDLNIKTPHMYQEVKNLSGGNQQKVVLAKWLRTDCKVLIFDEPTRGIDVGAKVEIYKLMNELVGSGLSIIMVSSELPEILGMSDRILVMHQGRIAAELMNCDQVTQEKIMFYATGGANNGRVN